MGLIQDQRVRAGNARRVQLGHRVEHVRRDLGRVGPVTDVEGGRLGVVEEARPAVVAIECQAIFSVGHLSGSRLGGRGVQGRPSPLPHVDQGQWLIKRALHFGQEHHLGHGHLGSGRLILGRRLVGRAKAHRHEVPAVRTVEVGHVASGQKVASDPHHGFVQLFPNPVAPGSPASS
jgi:hypothetical protein